MPITQPTLPQKYYLDHARELFSFIQNKCDHLLGDEHRQYLYGIDSLSDSAQCLLVRCLGRKPQFIKRATLSYAEIGEIESPLSELQSADYLRTADTGDWPQLLNELTKPQLITCLAQAPVKLKSSDNKQCLIDKAKEHLEGEDESVQPLLSNFVVRQRTDCIDYIFFLFFGDIRNRFQQFVMRDLGVMKTRNDAKTVARFNNFAEANNAFILQMKRRDFMLEPAKLRESTANYLLESVVIGQSAKETRDKLLLSVGEEYLNDDANKAIELWKASDEPKAIEKWVRESYKTGNRDELKQSLDELRESQTAPGTTAQSTLAPGTQVFIEDFYARKYLGKRTSVFTDMLRETNSTIEIDEAFINDVELGVIEHYQKQGITAVFSENTFWRVLFGLTFWDLLLGADQQQYSEFDRLPMPLKNDFYAQHETAIEQALAEFQTPERVIAKLTHRSVLHYGKPNGIFRWSPTILDSARRALSCKNANILAGVLRRMAANYKHTKDGYPDLLIIEDQTLRFEEIKAPGDTLRPNQLVSINRLRNAGFDVAVSQVNWASNPEQVYSVVDIETTGGRKGGNAITEIAVVHVQNGEIISQWSSLVNPQRHVPAHITRLTGIDNEMVATAPTFSEIADELEQQLKGTIFVAHNVGFDYGFIKAAYESINRAFRKPKFCTVANSRKTFPGLKSYSLGALTEHFDIDLNGHHRALNDAIATAHLLRLIQDTRANNSNVESAA